MSTKTNIQTHQSVVAIAQEEDRLKAIKLRKQNGFTSVLWTKSSEDGMEGIGNFAAQCGLSAEPVAQLSPSEVIIGYNSAGVAFYRISVPSVGDQEIASMVRLQAETRLPLPAEQMEMAWRADQMRNGQTGCIVAAARKKPLENFVENVRNFEPTKILLDCEGVVKAWRSFFGGTEKTAVVVSMTSQNTQVCLAEGGRLCNAMILDIGMDDFTVEDEAEKTQTSERFIQDMISVLELFGYNNHSDLPIFLLSDGSSEHMNIIFSFNSAGLDAQIALPDIKELHTSSEIGIREIYEYRVPIGLGLMAFEASKNELDIFKQIYKPITKKEKKHWRHSPIVTGGIAAAMLVLWLCVVVISDIVQPDRIDNSIKATNADINSLIQRQNVIKSVAKQRPDLLDLLTQVNTCGERGIKLESFHYKKDQPVTIRGEASGNDQLYKFEENLQKRKNINNVKRSASRDAKSKKNKFTITFHYKNFTQKAKEK